MHWIDQRFNLAFKWLLSKLGIVLTVLILLTITISIIVSSIYIISHKEWFYNIGDLNTLGDAFGGMSAPFIGMLGVVFTFFAFYVQYTFNIKQTEFYNLDKIDRKVDEYSRNLEKLCYVGGDVNTSVITLANRNAEIFANIDVNRKYEFSFEKNSVEEIFLYLLKFSLQVYNESRSKEKNFIAASAHLELGFLEEETIKQLHVYLKFFQFLSLLHEDFHDSNISKEKTDEVITLFLRKFEFYYPMYSHRMADIFMIYFAKKFNPKYLSDLILYYQRTCENYKKIVDIVDYSLLHKKER